MTKARRTTRKARPSRPPARPRARAPRFVGRDASPVLDRYPPKDPSLTVRGPPAPRSPAPASSTTPGAASGEATPEPSSSAPVPLISLERPFDVDEFSSLLGETSVRVTVPRDDLAEVLRRVSDFMGFGIYVYAITIRPTPADLLKSFVLELQRVDYDPDQRAWKPFLDKGTSDSPFGPSGTRT